MRNVLAIAAALLREAASRKWFLGMAVAISLTLVGLGFTLKMEVVDGALAATRLFGDLLTNDVQSADVALRPIYKAVSYVIFYGGLAFGVLACADFGPSLLSPGRIEHLLALPVRRWELLFGTFLGVLALSTIGALFGATGFTILFSVKTHTFTLRPIVAALLASATFTALYGGMLVSALFVRSAALSAAVGGGLFVAGIVAGHRATLAPMFESGLARGAFEAVTLLLPRVSTLADQSARIAGSEPVEPVALVRLVAGLIVFGLATLAAGIYRFDRQDY